MVGIFLLRHCVYPVSYRWFPAGSIPVVKLPEVETDTSSSLLSLRDIPLSTLMSNTSVHEDYHHLGCDAV
jgi:hypothetical protein